MGVAALCRHAWQLWMQLQGEAGRAALREAVGDGEYFVAVLPDESRLVQALPRGAKHPINYGREVPIYALTVLHRRPCVAQA